MLKRSSLKNRYLVLLALFFSEKIFSQCDTISTQEQFSIFYVNDVLYPTKNKLGKKDKVIAFYGGFYQDTIDVYIEDRFLRSVILKSNKANSQTGIICKYQAQRKRERIRFEYKNCIRKSIEFIADERYKYILVSRYDEEWFLKFSIGLILTE